MIMLLNVKIKHIFFLSFVIIANALFHESEWINHLINYIKKDLRISIVVFITDDNFDNETIKFESILRNVQSTIPSQVISLHKATLSIAEIQKHRRDLQSTTLFIAILLIKNNIENSSFPELEQFLIKLSAYQVRPKCLKIVFPRKEGLSYEGLLQKMWSKNFLDITILEITDKRSENNYSPWNRSRSITKVHHLNPFTGIYARESYGEKTKLFPNTLQNLNGYEMKVGSFNYPPYVEVKRNSIGQPISVSGPEAAVVKALSKAMNFKISQVPAQEEWWGRWLCENTSTATGFTRKLRDKEVQFLTNQGIKRYNCTLEFSRSIGTVRYSALILKSKENKRSLSLSIHGLYFVLLIVPIWLMTRLLKFESYYWSMLDIMQAMLGFTVPREPQRSAERIVFATVLITFSVFSSTLFAILTDLEIREDSDVVTDTLDDLNKTNLVPIMPEIVFNILKRGSEQIMKTLLEKARIDISRNQCREMLLGHESVACIDRESTSELFIQSHVDKDGNPVTQLVKETFGLYNKAMLFEKNSPFVQAVDKILIKLLESGLTSHWHKPVSSRLIKVEKSPFNEEQQSANLVIPLLIVMATGYGLAIVVFAIEFFWVKIKKLAFK